jgi:hypothetical protein
MNGDDFVTVVVLDESESSLEADCALDLALPDSKDCLGELTVDLLGDGIMVVCVTSSSFGDTYAWPARSMLVVHTVRAQRQVYRISTGSRVYKIPSVVVGMMFVVLTPHF